MKLAIFLICGISVLGVVFLAMQKDRAQYQEKSQQENALAIQAETAEEETEEVQPKTCEEIIASSPFYRVDRLQAAKAEKELRLQGDTNTADALQAISCVPQGIWVSRQHREWQLEQIQSDITAAQKQEKIPVFVMYSGPNPQNTQWRHIESNETYKNWISAFSNSIGNATVWIIVEPDAIPLSFNYTEHEQEQRLSEIRAAVETIKTKNPNAKVYIDAGHARWRSAMDISNALKRAGVFLADGFSLNVSNHQVLEQEIAYGTSISVLLDDAHFVIDVGQAGKDIGAEEWCNAPGRALGQLPTMKTGSVRVDALLWIKPPGESDGTCNGGPPAGRFWLDYAAQLINNTR